jgi:hypothetical protein
MMAEIPVQFSSNEVHNLLEGCSTKLRPFTTTVKNIEDYVSLLDTLFKRFRWHGLHLLSL